VKGKKSPCLINVKNYGPVGIRRVGDLGEGGGR